MNFYKRASITRSTSSTEALRFSEEPRLFGYSDPLARQRTNYDADGLQVRYGGRRLFVERLRNFQTIIITLMLG